MTTLFRIVRLITIGAWVGSLVFFGAVANVAFKTMPTPVLAGTIVRGSLSQLHHFGLVEGTVFLFITLAMLATQRDSHPARAAEVALVLCMLALTAYSQLSIMPRMESDRLSLGGDVTKASMDNPAYQHFERLHRLSVKFEGAVLIEGLIVLSLCAIHGRDDFDRFA